jgi:hypothetical protein
MGDRGIYSPVLIPLSHQVLGWFYFVWFVYFVVEKSLCSLRSLWLKRSGYFVWKGDARPQPGLLPQEKEPAAASSAFSVMRPADPDSGIFKKAGNVKILSWGRGKR